MGCGGCAVGGWAGGLPSQGGCAYLREVPGTRKSRPDPQTAAASEELRKQVEETGRQEVLGRGSLRQPCWVEAASGQRVDTAGHSSKMSGPRPLSKERSAKQPLSREGEVLRWREGHEPGYRAGSEKKGTLT